MRILDSSASSGVYPDYSGRVTRETLRNFRASHAEVLAHERLHQAIGGAAVGSASYVYQRGPDGRFYAVGGRVNVSIPAGASPDEALRMLQQVQLAAVSPENPSPQDLATTGQIIGAIRRAQTRIDQLKAAKATKDPSAAPKFRPDYSSVPDFAKVAGVLASSPKFILYA
jgi:hypothetical protein